MLYLELLEAGTAMTANICVAQLPKLSEVQQENDQNGRMFTFLTAMLGHMLQIYLAKVSGTWWRVTTLPAVFEGSCVI